MRRSRRKAAVNLPVHSTPFHSQVSSLAGGIEAPVPCHRKFRRLFAGTSVSWSHLDGWHGSRRPRLPRLQWHEVRSTLVPRPLDARLLLACSSRHEVSPSRSGLVEEPSLARGARRYRPPGAYLGGAKRTPFHSAIQSWPLGSASPSARFGKRSALSSRMCLGIATRLALWIGVCTVSDINDTSTMNCQRRIAIGTCLGNSTFARASTTLGWARATAAGAQRSSGP